MTMIKNSHHKHDHVDCKSLCGGRVTIFFTNITNYILYFKLSKALFISKLPIFVRSFRKKHN